VLACLVAPLAASSAAAPAGPAGPARVVVSKPSPGVIGEAIAAVAPGGTVRIQAGRWLPADGRLPARGREAGMSSPTE
jgi:hypothetical protein